MVLYSIHDTLAQTWFYPQVAENVEVAKRDYSKVIRNPTFPVADVEVVLVGDWDDVKGVIKAVDHQIIVPKPEKE